jgi:hypothetical protein
MKLSVDRQEQQKKGFFGGTYICYETNIKIVLTDEEEKAARKLGYMDKVIFGMERGGQNKNEAASALQFCEKTTIELRDLVSGITAKAKEDEINGLAGLENKIRERCKQVKSALDTYISNQQAFKGGGFEEEL